MKSAATSRILRVIDVRSPAERAADAAKATPGKSSGSWSSLVSAADLLLGAPSREARRAPEPPVADAEPRLELTPEVLSEAVVVWSGKGVGLSEPDRDTRRLIERFGRDESERVVSAVRHLQAEFAETTRLPGETRWQAADRAAAAFAEGQPRMSRAAVEALRWCYAYDVRHSCDMHGTEL